MELIISSVTHRCGSTMLQRIFNARKQTLIWGEHYGSLTKFAEVYNGLISFAEKYTEQRENYFSSNKNTNNWIACMTPGAEFAQKAVINSTKVFFQEYYAQHREKHDVIGFKEVRYGEHELELFRQCFPSAIMILLVRHPVSVWKSAYGTKWYESRIGNLDFFIKEWNQNASFYKNLSKNKNVYLLKYEDIVSQNSDTINLISELAQLTKRQVEDVLTEKIYSTKCDVLPKGHENLVRTKCKEVMNQYHYI